MNNALKLECTCMEWWGDMWQDKRPFAIDESYCDDSNLPNAPLTIFILTPDPLEAAQLLRLAADRLENEPSLLIPIQLSREPIESTDDDEVPF